MIPYFSAHTHYKKFEYLNINKPNENCSQESPDYPKQII